MAGSGRESRWALIGLAAGLLVTSGCFFEPRDPEPPVSGTPVIYLPRGEAENVWANAEIALDNLQASGWDDAISETFTYEADTQTRQDFPGVDWDAWDRAQEMAFIENFFNNVRGVDSELRVEDRFVDQPSGGEATWDFIYALTVTDANDIETKYRGLVEVELKLIGSFWYINRWFDQQGEDDPDTGAPLPTMGSLRGAFASKKIQEVLY